MNVWGLKQKGRKENFTGACFLFFRSMNTEISCYLLQPALRSARYINTFQLWLCGQSWFVIAIVCRQRDKHFKTIYSFTSPVSLGIQLLSKIIGKNGVFYPTDYKFTAPYGSLGPTNTFSRAHEESASQLLHSLNRHYSWNIILLGISLWSIELYYERAIK